MRKAYRKWRDKRISSKEPSTIANLSSQTDNASTLNGNAKLSLITKATVKPEAAKAIPASEGIWNSAYDKLKVDEPKLVQGYEKILSLKLNNSAVSSESADVENTIENEDVLVRREQMRQLTNNTIQETSFKNRRGTAIRVVNTTKKLVSDAVRDIPQAALPWAMVCISLEILTNPLSQTEANHTGVEYIGTTINWYCEQASLLFDDSSKDGSFTGVQNELQIAFVDFYKSLLHFQMKNICIYYRNRGITFLRDLIKLDDWHGNLDSIKEADTFLRGKIQALLSFKSESHLKVLLHHTKEQEKYQRTQADQQCLRDLRITDPRADRSRIENTKGGLLQESYRWILDNSQFQTWRDNDDNRMLWLRGDPGKGKTMLLCGIAQELMQQPSPSLVTFFFCQATVPSINNHLAVLRGLIWLLADQHPSLISYIRKFYDTTGKSLFDEANAWYILSEIFHNMLRDEDLPPVYIIIDAVDECITGRMELLQLIQNISTLPSVKLAVSSRNWREIEEVLTDGMNLSLEVNAAVVAAAVDAYISHRASQVSLLKYDDELKEEFCRQMREKADGTFLWVAIVFERLDSESSAYYDDTSDAMAILDEMPKDLTELYNVMLQRISQLKGKGPALCRTILAMATVAYRPLHLNELSTLAGFQSNLKKLPQLNLLIKDCGSFLTVREDYIYFIHQSAKEHLVNDLPSQPIIFPHGMRKVTYNMILNSLNAMQQVLRENIFGLKYPDTVVENISPPSPNPLGHVVYSCTNWVAHLCDIYSSTDDESLLSGLVNEEEILRFMKKHFLHWLEALALLHNLPANISHVQKLNGLLKQRSTTGELQKLMYDASRFMQYHVQIMESAPLQIYLSAFLFSPSQSLVYTHLSNTLSWAKHVSKSVKESSWSPRLQKIEHKDPEKLCSSGTKILIYSSTSEDVEIWDMATGKRVHTLSHANRVFHAVFSSERNHVLAITGDEVYCWDANSGAVVQKTHFGEFVDGRMYVVSSNGKFIASCTFYMQDENDRVEIYFVDEGTKLYLPHTATPSMTVLTWSNDSQYLAVTTEATTRVWQASSGKEKLEHSGSDKVRGKPSFSSNSKLIAFPTGRDFEIWDLETEEKTLTVSAEDSWAVEIVEFSKDSKLIAETRYHSNNGIGQQVVMIWDATTGLKQNELSVGSQEIAGLAWSDDGHTLAVAYSYSIEIYDLTEHDYWSFNTYDKPSSYQTERSPNIIVYSTNFELVATADRYLAIWDTTTGSLLQAFDKVNTRSIFRVQFSQDAKSIYIFSEVEGLQRWDIASGSEMHTFPTLPAMSRLSGIAFSYDGRFLASESKTKDEIMLWNLTTAEERGCLSTDWKEKGLSDNHPLALSRNARYLVFAEYLVSEDSSTTSYNFAIWNAETGQELWTVEAAVKYYRGTTPCNTCRIVATNDRESIAISNDGSRVIYMERGRHGLWILTKGGQKTRLQICCRYFDPSFDIESDTYIITQLGRIAIDTLIAQAKNLTGPEPSSYDYHFLAEGYGVSLDRSWITWNGKNILWLPLDYRPTASIAVSRHCIVMTNFVGYPCILRFSGPPGLP